MSSAPLFAEATGLAMVCTFRWRRYWPLILAYFIVILLFVEAYSNRHFYHVLTLLSFDSASSYYRIGLIEEAFGRFDVGRQIPAPGGADSLRQQRLTGNARAGDHAGEQN